MRENFLAVAASVTPVIHFRVVVTPAPDMTEAEVQRYATELDRVLNDFWVGKYGSPLPRNVVQVERPNKEIV